MLRFNVALLVVGMSTAAMVQGCRNPTAYVSAGKGQTNLKAEDINCADIDTCENVASGLTAQALKKCGSDGLAGEKPLEESIQIGLSLWSEFTIDSILKKNDDSTHVQIVKQLVDNEDDPPLIFDWDRLHEFVQAIIAYTAASGALLSPFALPDPLNANAFKLALLNYLAGPGGAHPVGSSVIPCSQQQILQAVGSANALCFNAWFQAVAVAGPNTIPIARLYVPRPRTNTVDMALRPVAAPGVNLWV